VVDGLASKVGAKYPGTVGCYDGAQGGGVDACSVACDLEATPVAPCNLVIMHGRWWDVRRPCGVEATLHALSRWPCLATMLTLICSLMHCAWLALD